MNAVVEVNSEHFEALFREHYEGLGRYAFSILKNQSVSEDTVQKLFVNLWEKRKELRIQEIKPYLYRSIYNLSMNELKKIKKNQLHVEISERPEVSGSSDSSNGILQEELEGKIEQALQTLPEKCGEVFRMSRFSEMSYKEISEKLDISIKTVENHMGKALRLMRIELKEYLSEVIVILFLLKGW